MSEDKRSEPLPTMATKEDWEDAVKDRCWAKYSRDGLKLLHVPKNIKWYEIKEGTRVICDRAFEMCLSLRKIAIPASVTGIGEWAFRGCSSLQEVVIPASVTSIGDWAFSGCESLRKVFIPASVKSIGDGAFSRCWSLREAVIPASVTSIGDGAFNECEALHVISRNPLFSAVDDCMLVDNVNHKLISSYNCKEYIAIPASMTGIGRYAFLGCSSLQEVVIPASVTSIGNGAFRGCEALRVVSRTPLFSAVDDCMLVDNVNHRLISSYNCKEHVAIPASVASIGSWAFSGCSSLCEVVIPASVTSIGYNAFAGCESLREVVIPASVTSIGNGAFWGCDSLSSVIVPRGQAGRFRELLRNSGCDLSAISIREQGGRPPAEGRGRGGKCKTFSKRKRKRAGFARATRIFAIFAPARRATKGNGPPDKTCRQ